MGVDSGAYDTVLVLHIMCAIIGLGGVFLNGIYGAESKRRRGREGLAVFEATERVGRIAEAFILALPFFGIALVLMSHGRWSFSQAWVMGALALYGFAIVLAFGFHLPNLRRMGRLMTELVEMSEARPAIAGGAVAADDAQASALAAAAAGPPPQALDLERRGKRAAMYGGTLNLVIVALVIFMVWKPGS
jgi:hypothetical protein